MEGSSLAVQVLEQAIPDVASECIPFCIPEWLYTVALKLGRLKFKACFEQVFCKLLAGSKDVLFQSHDIVVINYRCNSALTIGQWRVKFLKGTVDSDGKEPPALNCALMYPFHTSERCCDKLCAIHADVSLWEHQCMAEGKGVVKFPQASDKVEYALPLDLIVFIPDVSLDYSEAGVCIQNSLHPKGSDGYSSFNSNSILHRTNNTVVGLLKSLIEIRPGDQVPLCPTYVDWSAVWDRARWEVS